MMMTSEIQHCAGCEARYRAGQLDDNGYCHLCVDLGKTPPLPTLTLDGASWQAISAADGPAFYVASLTVAGARFVAIAIEVGRDELTGIQIAMSRADGHLASELLDLASRIAAFLGADGPFNTVEVLGRPCVVVILPAND